tara:strand:- start:65 stop:256 length:192 start_codon:yes stop_codon:yes gene_type:complete
MQITDAFQTPSGIGLKHVTRVWGEPGTMPEKVEVFDWFTPTDRDFSRAQEELALFQSAQAGEA